MARLVGQQNLDAAPRAQAHPERSLPGYPVSYAVSVVVGAFEIAAVAVLDRHHQPAVKMAVYLQRLA